MGCVQAMPALRAKGTLFCYLFVFGIKMVKNVKSDFEKYFLRQILPLLFCLYLISLKNK